MPLNRIDWNSETAFNFTIGYKYIRNLFEVQSNFQVVSWETLWLHLEWLISCFSSEKKSSDSIIRNFQDFFHKIYDRCQTKIWPALKKITWKYLINGKSFRLKLTSWSESLIHELEEKKRINRNQMAHFYRHALLKLQPEVAWLVIFS